MSISGRRFGLYSVFFQGFTKNIISKQRWGEGGMLKGKTKVSFVPFRVPSLISFVKVLPVPVN